MNTKGWSDNLIVTDMTNYTQMFSGSNPGYIENDTKE